MQAPFRIDGHLVSASLSLGIAVFPADGTDPDTLIRKADAAMHHAKARSCTDFVRRGPAR
jgi:GGDEF domain-containing protein